MMKSMVLLAVLAGANAQMPADLICNAKVLALEFAAMIIPERATGNGESTVR
jgi:hypothetical protein